MKNIRVIDCAENAVYDIFAATDEEFALIFAPGTDIGFIDEVYQRASTDVMDSAFAAIWQRRVPKRDAMGIHGLLYDGSDFKKIHYPARRDDDAVNPDGSALR